MKRNIQPKRTVIDDESIQAFEPVKVATWAFWVATLLMVIVPFVLIFID
jgi:prepilin-type N-terminal cleavage/methylation domain-containing protein